MASALRLAALFALLSLSAGATVTISADAIKPSRPNTAGVAGLPQRRFPVACSSQHGLGAADSGAAGRAAPLPGCSPRPGGVCDRLVRDAFLSPEEVVSLVSMAERGMAKEPKKKGKKGGAAAAVGPTIMDVNSGWVLGSGEQRPASIYAAGERLFSEEVRGGAAAAVAAAPVAAAAPRADLPPSPLPRNTPCTATPRRG